MIKYACLFARLANHLMDIVGRLLSRDFPSSLLISFHSFCNYCTEIVEMYSFLLLLDLYLFDFFYLLPKLLLRSSGTHWNLYLIVCTISSLGNEIPPDCVRSSVGDKLWQRSSARSPFIPPCTVLQTHSEIFSAGPSLNVCMIG